MVILHSYVSLPEGIPQTKVVVFSPQPCTIRVIRHLFDLRQYRRQVLGGGAFLHHVPQLSGGCL